MTLKLGQKITLLPSCNGYGLVRRQKYWKDRSKLQAHGRHFSLTNHALQTQKANQRYSRAAYLSPIDEIKDQIFSVGSTSFKSTLDAVADYAHNPLAGPGSLVIIQPTHVIITGLLSLYLWSLSVFSVGAWSPVQRQEAVSSPSGLNTQIDDGKATE